MLALLIRTVRVKLQGSWIEVLINCYFGVFGIVDYVQLIKIYQLRLHYS